MLGVADLEQKVINSFELNGLKLIQYNSIPGKWSYFDRDEYGRLSLSVWGYDDPAKIDLSYFHHRFKSLHQSCDTKLEQFYYHLMKLTKGLIWQSVTDSI